MTTPTDPTALPAVAFDLETRLIMPGRLAPALICLSVAVDTDKPRLYGRDDALEIAADLIGKAADRQIRLVAHNAAFDLGVLCAELPDLVPKVWHAYQVGGIACTQTREKLRKIALDRSRYDPIQGRPPRYSLAALVSEYLEIDISADKHEDAWRYRYRELEGVPVSDWPIAAVRYAKHDAAFCLAIYQRQAQEQGGQLFGDEVAQTEAAFALHLAGAWGLRTDPVAVAELSAHLTASVEAANAELRALGYVRANGSKDTKAIKQAVTEAYARSDRQAPTTDKGNVRTNEDTLRQSGDPGLVLLADAAADRTELSTFVPVLESGTKAPINPRYNVLVASGRTSCSGPNVQNQPRRSGVRECYVPRPGHVYAGADWSAAELVAFAQILIDMVGHSELAEALIAGRDPHLVTAAEIVGCSYADAVTLRKAGDAEIKAARQLAKALNFGLPGGLGAEAFVNFARASYGVELTVERGRELRELWLGRYPEVRDYFALIGQQVDEGGGSLTFVEPRTGFVRGGCSYTAGCNTPFQNMVALAAKRALVRVSRECYTGLAEQVVRHEGRSVLQQSRSPLWESRPVLFVHDEIIVEAPEDRAPEAGDRLAEIMVDELGAFATDLRPAVRAEPVLMRRWYKGAETVRDERGQLMIWEPSQE